jgi:protein-S-isoprenylcysteine O-methyltransferase Ste14
MVTAIYWALTALREKPAVRRQSFISRVLHIALAGAAFLLIWDKTTGIGFLGRRFVSTTAWIQWLGLLLTVCGCAFAIWARACLGSNWSATVTVKQNHELIRRGPYAVVRHPIYSGFLLGLAGSALVVGEIRALCGLGLGFLTFYWKSGLEEQFMREQFAAEYERYAQRVSRLIPLVL